MEGGRFGRLRGLLGLASHESDEIGVHSGVLRLEWDGSKFGRWEDNIISRGN